MGIQLCAWLLLLALSCRLLDLTDAVRAGEHTTLHGDETVSGAKSRVPSSTRQHLESLGSIGLNGAVGHGAANAVAPEAQGQQLHSSSRHRPARGHIADTTSDASRRLQQFGPVYADLPADLTGLESILAAARDAFTLFEPHMLPPPADPPQQVARSRSLGGLSPSRLVRGADDASLIISFRSAHPDIPVPLRLPGPPRSFNVTVTPMGGGGPQQPCSHTRVPYGDQELPCAGMAPGSQWQATIVDADADDLILASVNLTVSSESSSLEIPVELGLLSVEAAFDQLAWAGIYYPRPCHSTTTIIIHAQIVGAQVVIYTRQGGNDVIWDVQWTGSEGTTTFFLAPGVRSVYYANMSVGETVLRSTPITLDEPLYYQDPANEVESVSQLQQQQLIAVPQLLCTGEVEQVRGSAGTFPPSLELQDSKQQPIYHPRGFNCRWELVPDQPDVLLSVDYRGLLPDESITLELAPNNVIRLTPPDGGPGAVFQASVWVERSILVSFQTTRTNTSRVGAFSISWTSVSSGNRSILDGKTMVVVLSCVSAAGAVLAACCFYFVCCGRRRRAGAVVVDGDESPQRGGAQLVRVPSEVRNLLPSKPYQAPEANPLPGAALEPDCCSICLVELEEGEQVTVLPCMHFYHKDCIGSWLKRNCTCPLCKNNVLEAFKVQQYEALQKVRRSNRRRPSSSSPLQLDGAGSAAALPDSTPFSPSAQSVQLGNAAADAQQLEMAVVQSASSAARAGSRSPLPWLAADVFRTPSPATAALRSSSTDVAVPGGASMVLAPADTHARGGQLPPLPQQLMLHTLPPLGTDHATGSSNHSPAVGGGEATTGVTVAPLVIPPSPSPSMISLQSGTVLATPEDFAPAAAAAAALFATAASRPRSLSPSSMAGAAANAAQASVAVLRSSSRNLGRRLQGMLSPAAAAVPEGQSVPGSRSSSGIGSPQAAVAAGSFAAAAAPRLAVSIYAYAGHPLGADEEVEQQLEQSGAGAGDSAHQAITVLNLPGVVPDPHGPIQHQQQ